MIVYMCWQLPLRWARLVMVLACCAALAAIDIRGEIRKDLPGQGIFAGPVPSGVLVIEWDAGIMPAANFDAIDIIRPVGSMHKTAVFIDAMPDTSQPSPCYVITYRDFVDWRHEYRNNGDPRVFDIAYPGVCWFDKQGRLHVDSRYTRPEYVDGPVGGFTGREMPTSWSPDSFLIGEGEFVRIKDTFPHHPPASGRYVMFATPDSAIYQNLRMLARGMLSHTW